MCGNLVEGVPGGPHGDVQAREDQKGATVRAPRGAGIAIWALGVRRGIGRVPQMESGCGGGGHEHGRVSDTNTSIMPILALRCVDGYFC